jgi:PadR family transcriptional regulator, regulatory protein PadR
MSSPESEEGREPQKRPRPRRSREPAGGDGPRPSRSKKGERAQEPEAPPESPRAEQPLGWSFRDFMIPYILLALSMQRAHGYLIEQYLRGLGLMNVELSTLYRTLRQLEKDGLVHSTWEPGPDGPARRIYSLTDAGRWWLDSGAATLASYRTLIDRFFGSYSGPAREQRNKD